MESLIKDVYEKWQNIFFKDESMHYKKLSPMKIGLKMKLIREANDVSKTELAIRLKVNRKTVILLEKGYRLPSLEYKFIERYISEDLWEKLLSTYRMDSYENIWEALFLCHQLFRAVSGEVAERLHYAYPEYDRNITKYTRDMYKKYTGKTGCLDSTYAADIEERREQ